ncbi:MAG: glycosyltransferase family 4 protein [Candidatus Melainabacteria bacterium]|nr:glycosyltransferase family 4 protein [Candidatus Melainabacteria bacterium]
MRSLFCMASNDISGGNKVFRHWMKLLIEDGQEVHCYIWDKRRQFSGWSDLPIVNQETIEETSTKDFDFVLFSNTFLVPIFLPHVANARPVLMSMAYESFHYGKTYEQALTDKNAFTKILRLPISIMAVSKGVQNLLRERVGVSSYYVPHGIESHFYLRPATPFSNSPKRILMVGSYLSPWKGMTAGFEAIERLSKEIDVQLVLITQPTINRNIFDKYSFPIEFHCRPELDQVPEIYASCHVHLCCSWHEGTGMPTLECMNSGVPVIATKNDGIVEFAKDGENILLVDKNNSDGMYDKLRLLLSNQELSERLREQGTIAMRPYTWEACFALFKEAQLAIRESVSPIEVDAVQMDQLLDELEAEGLYTPLDTYNTLNSLDKELHNLCEKLSRRELSVPAAVAELNNIKDGLTAYVQNEKNEYHDSFRAPFDLCRLLLSLKDEPKFVEYAAAISSQQRAARK